MNKKLLGSLSPAYGIATGQGIIGKLADKGLLGLGPRMIASGAQRDREERKARAGALPSVEVSSTGMKKGGAVKSASKRADGCAQRGKTKGRMI